MLALEHTRLPADQAIGYSAGWHAHLARLAAHLSGSALPEWDEAFADALPAYRRSGSAVVQPPTMDA